jgi:hypothetical protein
VDVLFDVDVIDSCATTAINPPAFISSYTYSIRSGVFLSLVPLAGFSNVDIACNSNSYTFTLIDVTSSTVLATSNSAISTVFTLGANNV